MTQEQLKKIVSYDENTGVFTWLKSSKYTKYNEGKEIGGLDKSTGYKTAFINGKKYRQHRLVWLFIYGYMPKEFIDHINHNRADNRICNLREVNRSENSRNQKIAKNNKSGIMGVYFLKKTQKWYSQIRVDGKLNHLGYFKDKEDAVNARRNAEKQNSFHKNHGQGGF